MDTQNLAHQPEALKAALRHLINSNEALIKALRDIHAMPGVSQGAAIIASAAIFQATGELP